VPGRLSTLAANLRKHGVPLSVGKCVVATVRPHDAAVLVSIRELNLNLQIIFNKEAVMILPRGTDKSTDFSAALSDLGLSHQSVVGIGDAENDHELLASCGRSVAVAKSIPALKQSPDLVTSGSYGAGVTEVIDC
jgi:hydroxymethylpyrimidine pyrophosphatase-like HAD family hydrolase